MLEAPTCTECGSIGCDTADSMVLKCANCNHRFETPAWVISSRIAHSMVVMAHWLHDIALWCAGYSTCALGGHRGR